jgi:ferritin-like protein
VLLTGGAAVVIGGAAGTTLAAMRPLPRTHAPPAPTALVAALAAEDQLLAALQTALATAAGSTAALRPALTAIKDDHLAHRTAVQAALAAYRPPDGISPSVVTGSPVTGSTSPTPPSRTGSSSAALSAAEQRAATAAAGRAAELTGRDATLLASIAACEATHSSWLSGLST